MVPALRGGIDARIEHDIEGAFRAMAPQVVGLTAFTSQVNIVQRIAAQLKALDPEVFIVVGGHHATVAAEDFNQPAIDAVVIGEGVIAMCEIARGTSANGSSHSPRCAPRWAAPRSAIGGRRTQDRG